MAQPLARRWSFALRATHGAAKVVAPNFFLRNLPVLFEPLLGLVHLWALGMYDAPEAGSVVCFS